MDSKSAKGAVTRQFSPNFRGPMAATARVFSWRKCSAEALLHPKAFIEESVRGQKGAYKHFAICGGRALPRGTSPLLVEAERGAEAPLYRAGFPEGGRSWHHRRAVDYDVRPAQA